ncbi:ATP-binding protein [Roseospirillum parvum]|uniref:ATP-binding protein n=1 Tax=Roseospirillum parvum TaxID=83401 RepID=UPI0015A211DA|nr:ATP-binding protein [Roseospirillum parvum]
MLIDSVRARLWLCLVLVVAPLVAALVHGTLERRQAALAEVERRALIQAEVAAGGYRAMIDQARSLLTGLAAYDRDNRGLEADCQPLFGALSATHANLGGLWATGPEGVVGPCRPVADTAAIDISDRLYFQQLRDGASFAVSRVVVGRRYREPTQVLAVARRDVSGAFKGIIAVALQLNQLDQRFNRFLGGPGASLVILDQDLHGLVHHPGIAGFIGQDLSTTPLGRAFIEGRQANLTTIGPDGVKRIFGLVEPGGLPVHVAVGLPVHHVQAGIEQALLAQWVALAASLLLAIGIAWLAARQLILKWIGRANQAIAAVADRRDGDALARLTGSLTGAPGEWREVGRAVAALAQRLDEREREVAEVSANAARHEEQTHVVDHLLEATSDLVFLFDERGHFVYLNPQARRVLGLSEAEVLGRHWRELDLDSLAMESFDLARGQALATGQPLSARVRMAGADGEIHHYDYVVSPIEALAGNRARAMCHARDVTEAQRQADQLAEMTERLQRSNADLEQFAYVASHDLQEPLRKVSGFGSLLKRELGGTMTPEIGEYLDYMIDGAHRMQALIDDLLGYSRIATRAQPFEPVDLNGVIEDCRALLGQSLDEAKARLTVPDLPTLDAEPTQMRQLFRNLLGNALKYRHPERPLEIILSRQKAPRDRLVLRLADNGIGFPQERAEDLFLPFRRLHGRSGIPGNGMGLAICKRIVEHHGGTIRAEGRIDAGASFIIDLPLRHQDLPDRSDAETPASPPAEHQPAVPGLTDG